MKSNKIVRNIFNVALSNITILLAGILNGFFIPKIMSVTDYGFYKIFTLYATYISLLHLGFIDGILIIYGGKSIDELNPNSFRCYSRFLFTLEGTISVLVAVMALFLPGNYKFIFIMLAINIFFTNVALYFQYISQVTERFKELTIRNVIRSVLNILVTGVLFVLYTTINYYTSSNLYIFLVVMINVFLAGWYLFTYKKMWIGEANSFSIEKQNIKTIFFEGIPYTIAAFLASLVLTIDRQFVSITFSTEIYAVYAFAYNMLALITTATGAISTVLYPYLKKKAESSIELLPKLRIIISILVGIMLCSYFVLVYIVKAFLPKYVDSLHIFYIILPSLVFSSINTIVLANFFKIFRKQKAYMIISGLSLALSILANVIAYYAFGTTSSISWASTIVIVIWYLSLNIYFFIKYKLRFLINFIYCVLISIGFYSIAHFFPNIIGLFLYILVFATTTIIVYNKYLFSIIKRRKI